MNNGQIKSSEKEDASVNAQPISMEENIVTVWNHFYVWKYHVDNKNITNTSVYNSNNVVNYSKMNITETH